MLVSRAGHYYCSCLAVNLLELLKRALYCYQAVETRREFPGSPQGKPSRSVWWRLSRNGSPFRGGQDGTTVAWTLFGLAGLPNPAEGGTQTDRQTDQSNGYGPGLKMLETPDISTLSGAGYVAFRSRLCDSKTLRFRCCRVAVGAVLVCWPNSLVFFKGRFFLMIERRHHSMWYVLTSFLGDSVFERFLFLKKEMRNTK